MRSLQPKRAAGREAESKSKPGRPSGARSIGMRRVYHAGALSLNAFPTASFGIGPSDGLGWPLQMSLGFFDGVEVGMA